MSKWQARRARSGCARNREGRVALAVATALAGVPLFGPVVAFFLEPAQ